MKQGQAVAFNAGGINIDYTPYVPTVSHKWTINKQFNNVTFKDVNRNNVLIQKQMGDVVKIMLEKHPELNICLDREKLKAILPILQKFCDCGKL